MNNTRRRDAARSRQALLAAAADLFAERGYAGTAIRSVGDRAGVDPALIARYFGGKEGLYQAVLAADPLIGQTGRGSAGAHEVAAGGDSGVTEAGPRSAREPAAGESAGAGEPGAEPAPDPHAAVRALIDRALDKWTSTGVSAAAQNVFRREVDTAARQATRERLDTVLLPLRGTTAGADPELAAELAVALLFGVGVARDAATLTRLSTATADELREPLTAALVAALGLADREQR
ncbi:transcriptional regulator, tetR family [Frankia sp. EI5c]|uniref:helix-turn-helix domain-containing protein n=1 Tax=Frankia sp. EI5c TaxID=683316 RepID=UPI0007C26A8D|nr:helix-turn-helix domain-containing protein [Frankia sp. EI5c]OAA27787.1 transcriptional regulator, tetR family [Frankia sp. EI5c]